MIEKYDVEIGADCDSSILAGTVTMLGCHIEICGSGRDIHVEIDGKSCPQLVEYFDEWLDPYDAVESVLSEVEGEHKIDDWFARVVNGKVVRLIVRDGLKFKVVRGTLVDEL